MNQQRDLNDTDADSATSQEENCETNNTDDGAICQHYIVGVGASAGGLEALEKMFANMPLDTGMSFVVVQHLSPDFKSHMDKLLSRVTEIPIEVVANGVQVEPNKIYLIPPKKEMVISNNKLLLTERSPEKVLSHPIDQFFRALAQDAGRYAIGVILSGTGSDGSRGVMDIHENEGLAIAQDPDTCRFDAMPVNARDTGCVAVTLAPETIGETLRRYTVEGEPIDSIDPTQIDVTEDGGLSRIFQLLQKAHKIDFSHYKSGTVGRRVQRRIQIGGFAGIEQYVEDLETNRDELNELYKDLLIGVTRFFRDPEAFKKLEFEVLPELLRGDIDDTLRVWVCGCATGQEAYSLAMMLSDIAERSEQPFDFKIFATDAHKESLQFAANGLYSEAAVEGLTQEQLKRFFVKRRNGYLVNTELRRRIVFAPHNLISDPPFTQMNLVTCRNLLIYFRPPAQRKTLSLFHFALKMNGVLFLGPSESPGQLGDEFETIDAHWKVYRKRRDVRLPIEMRVMSTGQGVIPSGVANQIPQRNPREFVNGLYDRLLERFMPPSVVVDDNFDVLHVFAGAENYLRVPTGRPSNNLLDIIYPQIKTTLAGAMQHVRQDAKPVRFAGIAHPTNSDAQLSLTVSPIRIDASKTDCMLIEFATSDAVPTTSEIDLSEVNVNEAAASRIETLEQELDYSRQNLQATIEELETSNEELQATNEEMVASNEELQSTNEELHSVNEELYTVNAEHQRRVAELDEANADMNNLLATTRVGVLFLDSELYIRRFTPQIARLLYLEPHDVGRSVESFLGRLDDPGFTLRLANVLETQTEQVWELELGGVGYLCRALPYWKDDRTVGIVVSFVNVQELNEVKRNLERFKFMADESIDALALIDSDGRIIYGNRAMERDCGYNHRELTGMSITEIDRDHDTEAVAARLLEAQSQDGTRFESTHTRKDGSSYPVEIALTPVEFEGLHFGFACIRNITGRRVAEAHRELLEQAVATVENGIAIADAFQEDNPITFVNHGFLKMTGYSRDEVLGKNCRFLQGEDTCQESVARIRKSIENKEPCRELILNYKRNGEVFWNDLFITPVKNSRGVVSHFVAVQNDITEQQRIAEESQSSERTIRLLLDSTAEGIFGVDSDGICTFCNASATELLGYDNPEEIVGKSMPNLLQGSNPDHSESPLHGCYRTAEQINRTGEKFNRKDGSSFPVEYWRHPIEIGEECVGAVITFVDITKRLELEKELRVARDQAESASQAKSRFLANMSHELRTPMAAIMGFAEIMQMETEDVQAKDRLQAIRRNGDYLLKLLNDVLDLSRIESGKVAVMRSETHLEEMLSDINELMQMRTTEYNSSLDFHYPLPLPATISTDEARLRQVLINLIANALKFSPEGEVNIHVKLDGEGEQTKLRFDIEDNGIGMDEEQQAMLFEPFTQGSDAITKRFGGTGLGLSITHRLVEALGGEIAVKSTLGEGSTFTVLIPVLPIGELSEIKFQKHRKSQEADAEVEAIAQKPIHARVLVVDDMRDVRFVAEHFLKKAGCDIEIATNGRQAVDMILAAYETDNPFELVLMDMQMPVMSGEEAVSELREKDISVPIIALTADAMKGTRRRLLQAGFDEYISKPIDSKKLLAMVRRVLEG